MQVIGEVLQTSPHVVVKAMKIQDLTEENTAQKIWDSEVQHQKAFLASYYPNQVVGLEG